MSFKPNDWVTVLEIESNEARSVEQVYSIDGTKVLLQDPKNPDKAYCYYYSNQIRLATEEEINNENYQRRVNSFEIGDIAKAKNKTGFYEINGKKVVLNLMFLVGEEWLPVEDIELVCKSKNRCDLTKL